MMKPSNVGLLLVLVFWPPFALLSQQKDEDRKFVAATETRAKMGDGLAQDTLGDIFFYGLFDVSRNENTAANWYSKAAENGQTNSQYMLGFLRFMDGAVRRTCLRL
jgi:TPR repeat protein